MDDKYPLFTRDECKDSKGRWKTLALFWETRGASSEDLLPLMTTKELGREVDGVYYPSLKEEYINWGDPHEYDFVTNCLGTSMRHWKKLLGNAKIKIHIDEAREELELKIQAQGFKQQMELCEKGNYAASKLMLEKGWKSKEDLKKEGKATKKETGSTQDDDLTSFLQRVK